MAYIGNSPDAIQNSIEITRFNGTSACTQFQIPQDVDDAKAIEVLVNSVQQDPDNSYSVVNGLITFTEAPSTGTNNVTVLRRTGLTYTRTQVASEDILASAVTSTAIADGAVTGPKIGLTAINANNIVNGTVTGPKIGLTAINANNIVDGTITGAKLAANTVSGDVIGQNAVSSNNIISSVSLTTPVFTGFTETVVVIGTVGASHTFDITTGTVQTATLTASTPCTFTMPTATAGKSFILKLTQAASGMTTATFTGVKFAGGTAPTITATASAIDIISFIADGTSWFGSAIQNFS